MSTIPLNGRNGFRGRAGDPRKAPRCLAKTRHGGLCQLPAERNPVTGVRSRCRLHGGRSSGPRTEAGKARIAAASFRHGRYAKATLQKKRELRERLRALKGELNELAHEFPV